MVKPLNLASLALCTLLLLLNNAAPAAQLYRHLPFSSIISSDGSITVEYDGTSTQGIRCTSTNSTAHISFEHRGRKKSALLPVYLQSKHVPEMRGEELADASGIFTLTLDKDLPPGKKSKITCAYLSSKSLING